MPPLKESAVGARRRNPPLWDHQRHPLRALTLCVRRVIERDINSGPGTVVDLGCGDRPYEPLLRARGFDYVACDIEPPADILLRPGHPVPLADGTAEGVVSFQVLEHVWDLDWYLGEAKRLLKPSGWLLLSTHGSWLYHPHPTDFRRWTRDGLRAELECRGFRVESIQGLVGPLAWTTQFRALGFREALRGIPGLRLMIPVVMGIMNVRMLIEDWITPRNITQDNACMYVVLCRRGDENRFDVAPNPDWRTANATRGEVT